MCTGIRLKADNGAIIAARTLEFAQNIESDIVMIPRNFAIQATGPLGKPNGLAWKTSYAAVGANAAHQMGIIDGVNEKGLSGGLFYFTDYAEYQDVPQDKIDQSIACWELITWILTTCATVQEVKNQLLTIYVNKAMFGAWGVTPPVHAIVHDAQGDCCVIEYVQGKLTVFDNPLGVFTNAPTFDWHMTNLKNYINLDVYNVQEKKFDGITIKSLGQGSGLLGLPGDFTPPSRFVRAAIYSQSAVNLKDENAARKAAFHILNLFDIPLGSVRERNNGEIICECTQWTSVCDLRNKSYYFKTYENQNIRMVDLMQMDLESKDAKIIAMQCDQEITQNRDRQ